MVHANNVGINVQHWHCVNNRDVTVEKIKKMIDFPDLGRQELASEAAEETAVTAAGLTAAEGAEVEVA
jgi:hypothetical protein